MSYLSPFQSYRNTLVQIITFDRACLYFTPSFGVNPELWIPKFGPKRTRNITRSCDA